MANGDLVIYQGDSVDINVTGIPTDQNYQVYFAAQDLDRVPVGNEIMVESGGSAAVVIRLLGNYTNLFTVPDESKSQRYYYGIKICSVADQTEETLSIGGQEIGTLSTITVYPRKVEGI